MRLEFSPAADADLGQIGTFIAQDNVPRPITFIEELETVCMNLADFPHSGTARQDICPGLGSKPLGRYVVFYTVTKTGVRIERILHSARDIEDILSPD